MSSKLEEAYEELKRTHRGTQEMLAFVLHTIGEPVVVPKEVLTRGLPEGSVISINDDLQRDAFVFALEVPE